MSDNPSDPMTSRLRRNESRREPATIDLAATEVRNEAQTEATASQDPNAASSTSLQDPVVSAATAETADTNGRPTPDEVIPTDDAPASSPDPDMSSTSRGGTTVPPISMAEPQRPGAGFPSLLEIRRAHV